MLEIIAGNVHAEITTGTPYEIGGVPKFFLRFSDDTIAAVYPSGILKSVGNWAGQDHGQDEG